MKAASATPGVVSVMAWPAYSNREVQPYNALLSGHLESSGISVEEFDWRRLLTQPPDIWHIHWPDGVLNDPRRRAIIKSAALLVLISLARLRRTRVVWTAHNFRSHENNHPRFEKVFWKLYVRLLDGVLFLSEASRVEGLVRHPTLRDVPTAVTPIGHYRGVYPAGATREDARRQLGLPEDAPTILFLGLIRPYKGVEELIKAFARVPSPQARLVVAGRPLTDSLRAHLARLAATDPRVSMHLHFVPDNRLQYYFAAADLVVLPYRKILNSASALLALSFGPPVLVPEDGSMAELKETVGPSSVRSYVPPLTSSELSEALEWAMNGARPAPFLERHEWSAIARETVRFYDHTMRRAPVAPVDRPPHGSGTGNGSQRDGT
jgi:beta-1,4-mannosyltransferase